MKALQGHEKGDPSDLKSEQILTIRVASSIYIVYALVLLGCAIIVFRKYLHNLESFARRTEIKLFYASILLGSLISIGVQVS